MSEDPTYVAGVAVYEGDLIEWSWPEGHNTDLPGHGTFLELMGRPADGIVILEDVDGTKFHVPVDYMLHVDVI